MLVTVTESVYGMPETKDYIGYAISLLGIAVSAIFSGIVTVITYRNNKRLKEQENEQRKFYLYIAKNEAQKIYEAFTKINLENFNEIHSKINGEIHRDKYLAIPEDKQVKYFESDERILISDIWQVYGDWVKNCWLDKRGKFKLKFNDADKKNAVEEASKSREKIIALYEALKAVE